MAMALLRSWTEGAVASAWATEAHPSASITTSQTEPRTEPASMRPPYSRAATPGATAASGHPGSGGSAPPHARAVLDLRLAAGGDLDRVSEGEGVLLDVRMRLREHLPVASDRFDVKDLLDHVFVVAERDLPFALRGAAAQRGPRHLLAVADHVERLAHLDPDLLVAWRVIDLVLADELLRPALVGLVDADDALRQCHPEVVVSVVLDVEVHADLLVAHHLAIVPAVVIGLAVEDEAFVGVD